MYRQRFLSLFFIVLSFCVINLSGARAEIIEDKHYTVLTKPQPTEGSAKIEVLEFFWYGCPHCNSLHPHLKAWLADIPDDVSFRFVPANLRPSWVAGAKIFYTLEAIGKIDTLHDLVYDAIHRDKIDLHQDAVLFDWIEKQGVNREQFENAYNSFSVQNQVTKSTQIVRQYQLNGVPSLVVNGKYLTSGGMNSTPQGTVETLKALIEKARQEK